jgi:methionyl-tRNA formyltransferase
MLSENHYIVAGTKPWNRHVFNEVIAKYPGTWHFVSKPDELNAEEIARLNPRYIFFLHWSVKIPADIFNTFECVCFHMADVPYGRGGSPLQNLIQRGHRHSKLTALRMVEDLDAGPVYLQEELSLEGNAEEIYIRAACLSAEMIRHIIEDQPSPQPQTGKITIFKRRTPVESQIPILQSPQRLYDFIRMLDAEGYPHAFLEHGGFRYEFRRAAFYHGRIVADVTITPIQEESS